MQQSSLALRRPRLSLLIPTRPVESIGDTNLSAQDSQAEFVAAIELSTDLGAGAYAVVKRARRRDNGIACAVKCVHSDDPVHHRLAREEFDMLRSMKCPAIVNVSALYECGKSLYLCMELCNAGDVCSYVEANGPFSNAYSSSLFGQVLEGIRYIHIKRVVHCDIKHENILLHKNEAGLLVKLVDFNSAQRVGRVSSEVPMSCRGTRSFCAPELILYGIWNERVDIWSCGLCLYFMMYGRLPFDVSAPKTMKQLLEGKLPRAAWGRTDALSTHLIQQCLIVDGKERPPALELAQHCLFFDEASDCAGRNRRPREDPPYWHTGAVCQQDFAHLAACGLLCVNSSKGCASSTLSQCAAYLRSPHLPTQMSSALHSGVSSRTQPRFQIRERCCRDVDQTFRQLAHIKLKRAANVDGGESKMLAHTH